MLRRRAAVGLFVVALLGAAKLTAATEPETLVMPIAYGTHLPGLGKPAAALAKLVEERSGGTLVLRLKEPGDGTRPHEILEKVSRGKVDAGFATASLWAAKIPAAALFAGFPFGPDAKLYAAWFEQGGGRTLYQDMYDQADLRVHVIPCAFGGAETSGWFAKELKKPEDLDGLRMRIFGLGARVMQELGVEPMLVAGGSISEAFAKKEIDAAEFLTPAVDALAGLQEHAKLIYAPGWHQPETVMELLINKDRWTKLSPAQQTLIESACRDLLDRTREENARLQSEALATFKAKGVRTETWPSEMLNAFREAWGRVAKNEGDNDAFFRAVLTDLEELQGRQESGAAPTQASSPNASGAPSPSTARQPPAPTSKP